MHERLQVVRFGGIVRLLALHGQQRVVVVVAEQRVLFGQSVLEHFPHRQRVVLLEVGIDQLALVHSLQGEQVAGWGGREEDGDNGGGAVGEEGGEVVEEVEWRREGRSIGWKVSWAVSWERRSGTSRCGSGGPFMTCERGEE